MKASGVPRLSANGLRTGFLDIVELRIANIPIMHNTKKKYFEDCITVNILFNQLKEYLSL